MFFMLQTYKIIFLMLYPTPAKTKYFILDIYFECESLLLILIFFKGIWYLQREVMQK